MRINRRHFIHGTSLAAAGWTLAAASAVAAADRIRAWEVGARKGFDSMRLVERTAPQAGVGEVVIEVAATAINARDRGIVGGPWPPEVPPTLVPLSDGVGRIVALGDLPDTRDWQPAIGDRVVAAHFLDWQDGPWDMAYYPRDIGKSIDGWLAERIVLPANCLAPVADSVGDDTACTLTVAGVTAWHALRLGGLQAEFDAGAGFGDREPPTVLTLGTGGVSSWGVKLAKCAGARVVVTSSSDEKLAQMKALGADIGINYRTYPDWGQQVLERTNGRGADIVLENVGRPTLDQSMQAAASNAMIVVIGSGPVPKQLPTLSGLLLKNLTLRGITNAPRAMLAELAAAVARHDIEAVIGARFAFDAADDAFRFMAQSSHIGKVIIEHG